MSIFILKNGLKFSSFFVLFHRFSLNHKNLQNLYILEFDKILLYSYYMYMINCKRKSKKYNSSVSTSSYIANALSLVDDLFNQSVLELKKAIDIISKDGKTFDVKVTLPNKNFQPTDIVVEVYNGTIKVTAEKDNQKVSYYGELGIRIDEEKTEAKVEGDILTIKVVKAEQNPPRKIEVR